MIRCLIIDDEPLAIQLLADYVRQSPDLELIDSFTNPIEAFHFLNKQEVDLLFLDIQMPELTGIQLLKLTQNKYEVVFTTAYDQYAVDSYEMDAIDYLLKPISFERFLLCVQKIKKHVEKRISKEENIISNPPSYIFIKSGYKTIRLNFDDILYLEALGDYVAVHTPAGKTLTLENMRFFEEVLLSEQFVRIHRSYIVALSKIDFIERNRVVIKERYLPISKTYQESFWEKTRK